MWGTDLVVPGPILFLMSEGGYNLVKGRRRLATLRVEPRPAPPHAAHFFRFAVQDLLLGEKAGGSDRRRVVKPAKKGAGNWQITLSSRLTPAQRQ